MADKTTTCAKCGGEMQEGFILDTSRGPVLVSRWIQGSPETSAWTGGVKVGGRECRSVTTYRCAACGYLESYAVAPAAPPDWLHA